MNNEWDAKQACEFWPDQRGHWAPVSWKDHRDDFNIFYNGTVFIGLKGLPEDDPFTCELRVNLCGGEAAVGTCDRLIMSPLNPDGRHIVSWDRCPAPVYRIEQGLNNTPLLMTQSQFAHVPGGKSVKRGDEPHFLWMRFEVTDAIDMINPLERVSCCLAVVGPSLMCSMGAFNNIRFNSGFGVPRYPFTLWFDGGADLAAQAVLRQGPSAKAVRFAGGRWNRLGVPAGQRDVKARFLRSDLFAASNQTLGHLVLSMPARRGARVDVVFPACPVDDAVMDRELAVGYDGALREANRFWARELCTRTSIRVSEPLLQGWIDELPRLEAMIGEKTPRTGEYLLPSGSFFYEAIWPTPMALQAYAMEYAGFGREVAKYIEVFREHQGSIKPPSAYLDRHPGYLATPATHTSIDWLTDHGAILWMAANHGLLTMDRAFLARWMPAILKACDFIRDARRNRKHKGYPGIMPTGVANDCKTECQAAWNDVWTYKGLRTAAVLLARLRHPRARQFAREADAYKAAFQKAYRDVIRKSKRWVASNGDRVPFVPPTLAETKGFESAHAFSLDGGAPSLVFGGLLSADDPIMRASLRWFREGPQHRLFRSNSTCWQVPVLVREMSSCEPCYSWNLFHSFELGDRGLFTTGLYSLFAGGGSRQNFVSCETRNGVFGNCFTHGLALMLLRMSVIHEEGDELHLLKMAPLALFRDGGFEWKNVPTWYGEASIAARFEEKTGTLKIRWDAPTRSMPACTLLHLPPFEGLTKVQLNSENLEPGAGPVVL